MKFSYQTWWQIFQFQYSIKEHSDVNESGVYYNRERARFEAHFKPDENTKTKVIACLTDSQIEKYGKDVSSALMKELCLQLKKFYKRNKIKFDVPQFGELKGIL